MIRELIHEALLDRDLPVLVAEDGDAAALMIENPPCRLSVVLTDFHMPGSRHGLDVADQARRHDPRVHVFIMTGRPAALHRDRMPRDYTVVLKPMSIGGLADRLVSVVEH